MHRRKKERNSFVLISIYSIHSIHLIKDVTSYVIARTLGVVETTLASTNDKVTIAIEELAAVGVAAGAGRGSDVDSEDEGGEKADTSGGGERRFEMKIELDGTQQAPASDASGPPAYFFSPTEEKNLDLSGANILSPAVSRQGSPGVERRRRELAPVSEDVLLAGPDRAAAAAAVADVGEEGYASASTDSFAVVEHEQPVSDAGPAPDSGLRRRVGVSEENAATQHLQM